MFMLANIDLDLSRTCKPVRNLRTSQPRVPGKAYAFYLNKAIAFAQKEKKSLDRVMTEVVLGGMMGHPVKSAVLFWFSATRDLFFLIACELRQRFDPVWLRQIGAYMECGSNYLHENARPYGKAPAVFEATFNHQKVLVRVDVLQRLSKGKRWRLIEVKSSTKIKDYHLPDVTIQRFVLEGQGLTVIPCLMHLNREYVYNGRTHDLSKLFTIEDIMVETDNLLKDVPAEVRAQLKMLSKDKQTFTALQLATSGQSLRPECRNPATAELSPARHRV